MSAKLWRFDALDSWFFRESRPHETVGGTELASLFPPPARTVAGAVRTLIGETQQVGWDKFKEPEGYSDLKQQIGDADGFGQLQLTGPYLCKGGQRLYPVPLHLLTKTEAGQEKPKFACLRPGTEPVDCDLGRRIRLPELARPLPGAKPLENTWLDGADLKRVLVGEEPKRLYPKKALFTEEPRLGIARNNSRRTVEEGLLYQTRHIRLREGVSLGVTVDGIQPDLHPASGLLRFGGEGRPGAVTVLESPPKLEPVKPAEQYHGLLLMLLTHADFGGAWLPPGFTADERDGVKVWCGELRGVGLTIVSAALGKAVREGGWDLIGQRPRPVLGLVPAGGIYFCTVTGKLNDAIVALHGQHIGNDTQLGRGELAVGLW